MSAAAIAAGVGFGIAVILTIISGVQYRLVEDQGREPGLTPTWMAVGTYAALLVFAASVLIMLVTGVVAMLQRRRRR